MEANGHPHPSEHVNLHVYQTPFKHETRMLKETKSLVDAGIFDRIEIAAIWQPGLPETEDIDARRRVWRIKTLARSDSFVRKMLNYVIWQGRVFSKFRHKVSVVNCHSLVVLPLGWLFKRFTNAKVVYDTHELETESNSRRGLRRLIAKLAERAFIGSCDLVLTVNESIALWYRTHYGLRNVYAARNIPYRRELSQIHHTAGSSDVRQLLKLSDEALLFLYLGYMQANRGIEIMLEAFAQAGPDRHMLFIGDGELRPLIEDYSRKYANIHIHDMVKPTQVRDYAVQADVGMSLVTNTCLNHYYMLPNKLFEYISNGVPVIASNFPEMQRIVAEGGCGWPVEPEPQTVFKLINTITRADINLKRHNALAYSQRIGWQDEEKIMLLGYHESGVAARVAARGAAA